MSTFTFAQPTRVIFGPGAIESVGIEGARLGTRGLLVTGSTFARRSGLIERLRASAASAGVELALFDGLDQNPDVSALDEGAALARSKQADFVLGLGGGSALDAAKAIAAGAVTESTLWRFTGVGDGGRFSVEDALPLIQVPMIASTGSETNNVALIYHALSKTRAPIEGPALYAHVAIVDPALTFSVPSHYTAVGAMNIVSQMLECYLTSDEFAVTDRVTEGLVRVVMDSLSRAMRHGEDLDARSNLSWAATMASTVAVAGRSGSTPLRSLAYPLTARFDVEHGTALAGLWPSFMRYALSNRLRLPQIGRFKRYALLGRQLFGVHETDDEVAAETTMYRFTSWLRSMDMPTDLLHVGIDEQSLPELAGAAVRISGNGRRLPGGLSVEDIEHIYDGALRPAKGYL